jgi:hypothetical protein
MRGWVEEYGPLPGGSRYGALNARAVLVEAATVHEVLTPLAGSAGATPSA